MSGGFGGGWDRPGWEDAGGPGGRGGRGGPGSGRRGRGRLFDGGELRLVLLKLIGEGPRHGYD
ncbi:MAG: PadR family transcriptional regulator, partial [Alphaproteobacteria bacterium]|nr:PadR family transcriptional regulator [Alphaproteobacteria bacterium]